MKAVEFQATVRDGTIQIPEKYRKRFEKRVRVVLMHEEESVGSERDIIDHLIENPLRSENFKPLSREETHRQI